MRGGVVFFRGFRVPLKNGLAAAVRRVFPCFSVFFVDPVFANLKWSSSHPPLFLWVFSFLFAFFLGMGVTPHCTCVFGQLAFNPSYYFFVFWGLLTKALFFSLKKGYFGSFLSASLSFSLVFSLLFVTHSLSLSFSLLLLSCFLSFLVVLSLFLPSLFFVVFFLSCFLSLLFHEKNNNKILHLKTFIHKLFPFIFLFRLSNMFSSLLFHYLSCALAIFPRGPFLKHQFWFCTLRKVILFFRAHFDWGKFWLMFKNRCKNRYFGTLLRTIKMKQIPFSSLVRVGVLSWAK